MNTVGGNILYVLYNVINKSNIQNECLQYNVEIINTYISNCVLYVNSTDDGSKTKSTYLFFICIALKPFEYSIFIYIYIYIYL